MNDTTRWACANCLGPVAADRYDFWCPTCRDKTWAQRVDEPLPDPIRPGQYRRICSYFTSRGVVNRAERMRRLSSLAMRDIGDYWELTAAEGAFAAAWLQDWATGRIHVKRPA